MSTLFPRRRCRRLETTPAAQLGNISSHEDPDGCIDGCIDAVALPLVFSRCPSAPIKLPRSRHLDGHDEPCLEIYETDILQSLLSVETPTSRALSLSSRLTSRALPPSHGTSPATMPTLSVACTFMLSETTPTDAHLLDLTVRPNPS